MARRRRYPKNYKLVNAASKTVGSAGAQILIGKITKLNHQSIPNGYVHGVKISAMIQEAEQDTASIMFYLSTNDSWSDSDIISAAATGSTGGSAWLSAKRSIRTNATPDNSNDIMLSSFGPIYVYVEAGDYVASESIRYVAETWGRNVEFDSV